MSEPFTASTMPPGPEHTDLVIRVIAQVVRPVEANVMGTSSLFCPTEVIPCEYVNHG